jgi:hypothetical protein
LKNQYFGDVNDYFKYGMLRALGRELSVAVIWMLTPDDGSGDGRKLQYLERGGRRSHDPELFDWLELWYRDGAKRDVRLIEESGLLPNCRFFGEIVPDEAAARAEWFARAREFARGADLVFVDPDNGLPVKSKRPGARGWSKFVAMEEVKALYQDDHSVLIYQHMARVARRDFIRAKLRELHVLVGLEHVTSFGAFDWIGLLATNWRHEVALSRAARRIAIDWDSAIHVANNVVIGVPETTRAIAERTNKAFEKRCAAQTTAPGYVNRNRQEVIRKTDLPGNDHAQRVYVLRCGACGMEYGVNGSGIYQSKCPACQGGAAGLAVE